MASAGYGTLTTLDALASTNQVIGQIGENTAWQAIQDFLDAYNRIWREMLVGLCDITTDRQRIYGGDATMTMDVVDQFGRADAQKIGAGTTVGFPLRLNQISLQWTRKFFENTTGAQLAANVQAVTTGSERALVRDVKKALFGPTNSTFPDVLIDNVTLNVKALVNADSAEIPSGPNGETFTASTHTHYLGTSSFVAADLSAVVEAVVEHYATGEPIIAINRAQETAIRAFTGFTPYLDARLVGPTTALQARETFNEPVVLNNRAIGVFSAAGISAEVWIKPWVVSGYVCCYLTGTAMKPLAFRERNGGSGDLQLVADNEQYPLRARSWEQEYGIGVWSRTAASVLDVAHASYTAPTIT